MQNKGVEKKTLTAGIQSHMENGLKSKRVEELEPLMSYTVSCKLKYDMSSPFRFSDIHAYICIHKVYTYVHNIFN